MAKVLKSNKPNPAGFKIPHAGANYQFMGANSEVKNTALIMNDEHAAYLLKHYPENLTDVKEKDWHPIFKAKMKEIEQKQLDEFKEQNPSLAKRLIVKATGK